MIDPNRLNTGPNRPLLSSHDAMLAAMGAIAAGIELGPNGPVPEKISSAAGQEPQAPAEYLPEEGDGPNPWAGPEGEE